MEQDVKKRRILDHGDARRNIERMHTLNSRPQRTETIFFEHQLSMNEKLEPQKRICGSFRDSYPVFRASKNIRRQDSIEDSRNLVASKLRSLKKEVTHFLLDREALQS